ncbi:MAG: hypothetical protein ACLP6G_13765 [Terriglobales bacterium]
MKCILSHPAVSPRSYNHNVPTARPPRWYVIPLRVLLLTFLLTLLAFAVSLLLGILYTVIRGRLRGFHPDMTVAYRHIALPIALTAGAVALIVTSVLEVRSYRQAQALAQIARASR